MGETQKMFPCGCDDYKISFPAFVDQEKLNGRQLIGGIGYCKKALENCEVDKKQIDAVMDEIKWLLDTCSVKDIL